AIASICAVALGAAGIYVAYLLYAAKSMRVPKALPILEHKFYWDELYDAVLARPAQLLAVDLGRYVELPIIGGSIAELTRGFRPGSGEVGRAQNGLARAYGLALAGGVAILAVVFLSTR